jgi:hypothetical protein
MILERMQQEAVVVCGSMFWENEAEFELVGRSLGMKSRPSEYEAGALTRP